MTAIRLTTLVALLAALAVAACGRDPAAPAPPPVNDAARLVLYTSLPAERARAVADAYRAATGVIVNVMLESDDVLIEKLSRKEHHPGADVLWVSGAGHLAEAIDNDVLRPIASSELEALPEAFREPEGYWHGVGVRAELIVFDRRTVDAATLGGYASLADERWRGRLCLQHSLSERSRALVAALIAALGERDAELTVRGWRANLATGVFENQRDLLLAVESGACAIGIAGSDELARFQADGLGENLGFHFPPASAGGTQVNRSAAGVTRHANDALRATRFVAWLVSPRGQRVAHDGSYEYPVLAAVSPSPPLDAWPTFDASPASTARLGYLYRDAILLVERARYR